MVKNLPAMWETWVQSLDWKDPLEKGLAPYSSILAWRIPWMEEPGGVSKNQILEVTNTHILKLFLINNLYSVIIDII